jgi:hypothetical protein
MTHSECEDATENHAQRYPTLDIASYGQFHVVGMRQKGKIAIAEQPNGTRGMLALIIGKDKAANLEDTAGDTIKVCIHIRQLHASKLKCELCWHITGR